MHDLRNRIIDALRTVRDPELPVNVYDLGLIYELDLRPEGVVGIRMTLTTPNCPVAEQIPVDVRSAVEGVPGVERVVVELVWSPPWTGAMMSEDARLLLEMQGIDWQDSRGGARTTPLSIDRTDRPRRIHRH